MSDFNHQRWERLAKSRVYSRPKQVTSDDYIQDWIQTVEDASSRAAAATFGTPYVRSAPKSSAYHHAVDSHIHEAAYSEAQELLEQWASEKLNFTGDHLDDDYIDMPAIVPRKTPSDIKKEWDSFTEGFNVDSPQVTARTTKSNAGKGKTKLNEDPFHLLHADEDAVVNSIMQGLLQKQVVKDEFMQDLGFDNVKKHHPDPRTKMNLRHHQVKENRERREKEKQMRLREQQAKKDAEHHVRHALLKEEKAKELQAQQEEAEIQKQMAKIRKQLEEEKRQKAVENSRKRQEVEMLENALKSEKERLEAAEIQARLNWQQNTEERRQKILTKLEKIQQRQVVENLKLKRQYFAAWYNVVIERRLQMGKAKAVADWKLVFRTFCAWKSLHLSSKVEKEASRHQVLVKQMHRNESRAVEHYRRQVLSKVLTAWRVFVVAEQRERELERARDETRSKMSAFLEAAASGRLWTDREGAKSENHETPSEGQTDRSRVRPSSVRTQSTERRGSENKHLNVVSKPTEAWQVTRQHLKLKDLTSDRVQNNSENSKNDGRNVGQRTRRASETFINSAPDDSVADDEGQPVTERGRSTRAVNNFEHRHRAQQRMLEMQQQQLREQRRIIEEMQALQRQQMLQQQLVTAQQRQASATGSGMQRGSKQGFEPTHLHGHLKNMQNELFNNIDSPTNEDTSRTVPVSGGVSAPNTSRTDKTSQSAGSKAAEDSRHTKFLEAMQQRAMERERIKKEREERRQKIEEEKLLKLQQAEEERRLKEEEEKKEKLRLLREKKELERKKEAEKQMDLERMKELMAKAEQHHRKALMKFSGWRPWRKMMENVKSQEERADDFHKRCLLRTVTRAWHICLLEERTAKEKAADEMFNYLLLRRCLTGWRKCKQTAEIDERKAIRFYDRHTKLKVFKAWVQFTASEKTSAQQYEILSEQHNVVRIQRTCFRMWKRFPSVIRERKKMKKRLEEMRKTVASMIPDYGGRIATLDDSDSDS